MKPKHIEWKDIKGFKVAYVCSVMFGYIQNGQNGFVATAYVSSDKLGPYIIGVFDTEAESRAAVEAKIKEWMEWD